MLKELLNDESVATGSQVTASIVAKTVHRLYISVMKVSTDYDPDLIHLTVRVGEETVISRFSIEQLACIWFAENGGDATIAGGGNIATHNVLAIDLGTWVIPEGSKFYVEIDNQDAESQLFNVSAQVDEVSAPNPLAYNKSDDGNFSVGNLVDVWAWDSNGTLDETASYFQVDGKRVSVEQAWNFTIAECPGDMSAIKSFATIWNNANATDMEIQNEQSSTVTTLYTHQVENDDIDEATETVLKPLVAKHAGKLSSKNVRAAVRKAGGRVSALPKTIPLARKVGGFK